MNKGFTLIETLVAVTLLTISVVAPMTLTAKSLSTAYYARDQITASYLAQEAVEAVRAIRDGNVLRTALGTPTDLLEGNPEDPATQIPIGQNFTIDTRDNAIVLCTGGPGDQCPFLQTDSGGTFYGYDDGWDDTKFRRTVIAEFVTNPEDGTENRDEVRLSITVSWQTGTYTSRDVSISENLYRWVEAGGGS
jgi:prepilin-type N-terminal cleavage/methylation domain-containing protein